MTLTPKPWLDDGDVKVYAGDCIDVMAAMPAESVDAVCTDPPYALTFMGRGWDAYGPAEFQAWCEQWATEALRVLKPGGHLLAFGGTRTFHRLTSGLEDAGFEIRDCLSWLYGSGFPKSLDVSKAIDKAAGAEREVVGKNPNGRHVEPLRFNGQNARPNLVGVLPDITAPATEAAAAWQGWGTALKPGWEPIVLARKPLAGTVAANVQAHGTGALNIDGCRIGTEVIEVGHTASAGEHRDRWEGNHRTGETSTHVGRWPANVVLDEAAAHALDQQAGDRPTGKLEPHHRLRASENRAMSGPNQERNPRQSFGGDTGGPSRFFKVVKEDECLSLPGNASTADGSSSPPRSPEGSAPSDAVTPPSPVVEPVSSYPERSTTGTESASSASVASGTQTTPNTVPASSPVRLPDEHIPTPSPASSAGSSARTATTTTTASPSPSVGSAADATFASTPPPVLGVDAPGTSRTFYTAKASTAERNNGHGPANTHPTVKPVDLMRWCIRLVTPPGGLVLDPFAGSGSCGHAALLEGRRYLGIELSDGYADAARDRIGAAHRAAVDAANQSG